MQLNNIKSIIEELHISNDEVLSEAEGITKDDIFGDDMYIMLNVKTISNLYDWVKDKLTKSL